MTSHFIASRIPRRIFTRQSQANYLLVTRMFCTVAIDLILRLQKVVEEALPKTAEKSSSPVPALAKPYYEEETKRTQEPALPPLPPYKVTEKPLNK